MDWTAEESERLLELRDEGVSFREIGAALGRTRNAVKNRYTRLVAEANLCPDPSPEMDSAILDKWRSEEKKPTWKEILEHAEGGKELQHKLRPVQVEIDRSIATKTPIFVIFMADFHFGSPYTDYRAFLRTADLLKSNDRIFFCVVGPDLETAFHWFYSADAVLNQTIPPYMQIEAYRLWLDDMLSRAIAVCGDNHTDVRLEKRLGDIGLVWRDDLPYFRTWGLLRLKVGDVTYEVVMAHKYKGSSVYHDLQPNFRLLRETYPLADVYVTAHTHSPTIMSGTWFPQARGAGKERQLMIVAGTFKTGNDPFTLRNYGNRGVLGLPTLVLWPDKHQMVCFDSPEIAIELCS